jgi:DNA-binding transcriptional LysR family regulator
VQLALAEARALETDLAAWRGAIRGEVVVGMLPLSVSLLLPKAVEALVQRHPGLAVRLVDGTYESLMAQLRRADIDLLVGALRPATGADEVLQEVLFEDELAVVAPPGHPLLARARPRLRDLPGQAWVLPLPGSPASAALHRVLQAAGLPPPGNAIHAGSPAMVRSLVLQTGRLAMASRGEALQPDAAPLAPLPLALPGTARRIGLVWRSNGRPSADLQLLLQALREAAPFGHNQIG